MILNAPKERIGDSNLFISHLIVIVYLKKCAEFQMSIELPYDEVMRIVRLTGFIVEKEDRIISYYTINRSSMLQNQYTCAFFVATKPVPQ